MEGIGSRTGRPSSRYGSAPVFAGTVRRWQKQWVNVTSSSSSVSYNHNNNYTANGNNNNNVSAVRIRRWTPIPSSQSTGDPESAAEERPRRKLRYAPIVALESKKKETEKADVDVKEPSKMKQVIAQATSEKYDNEKRSFDNVLAAKAKASEKSAGTTKDLNHPIDLDIALKGHEEKHDHDMGGTKTVADWVKAAQRGFAR